MTAEEWKKEILSIDDPKILNYIQDCCSARQQLGRADHQLEEEPENLNGNPVAYSPPKPPKKYKSLSSIEPENPEDL